MVSRTPSLVFASRFLAPGASVLKRSLPPLASFLVFSMSLSPLRAEAATVAPFFTMPFDPLADARQLADVNGDGRMDLIAGNNAWDVRLNLGGRRFGPSLPLPAGIGGSPRTGDVDGDGRVDLVSLTESAPQEIVVARGGGDGTFGPPAHFPLARYVRVLRVGDMDGDGRDDLVTLSDPDVIGIHLSTPAGFAAPIERAAVAGTDDNSRCLALGDVNGDQHLDVIQGETGGGLGIYLGTGAGPVGPPQVLPNVEWTMDLALADMDGDQDIDIVTGGAATRPVRWLRNHGDGSFDDAVPLGEIGSADAVAVGDIDGDGMPDVVRARLAWETFRVFRGADGYGAAGSIEIGGNVYTRQLAVIDLDGDHHPDVCAAGYGAWWGSAAGPPGGWQRSRLVGSTIAGSRIIDVDRDGRGDLVTLTTGAVAIIERSLGDRRLAPPVAIGSPVQTPGQVGDLNGDGAPDLVHLSFAYPTASVHVRLNDGAGGFPSERTTSLPPDRLAGAEGVVTGDLNGDGRDDVLATGFGPYIFPPAPRFTFVLLADADGSLRVVGQADGLAPTGIVDLDGDGFGDVVEGGGLRTRRGLGDGTFGPPLSPGGPAGPMAFGHLDGDHYVDALVMGNDGRETWSAKGVPGATFAAPQFVRVNRAQMFPAIHDFDGDGKGDAALVGRNNFGNQTWIEVLLGDGAGGFPREFLLGTVDPDYLAPAIGDLDGDGRPDIAIAGYSLYQFHAIHYNTLVDYPVPTLLALVSLDVSSSRVRMVWNGEWNDEGEPWLERRDDHSAWQRAGSVRVLGSGSIETLDADVRPGAVYRYRLALATGPITAEASVAVPALSRLAIVSVFPQPSGGQVYARFSLPDGAAASLELFDAAGRRLESQDVAAFGAGMHTLALSAGRALAPGIYLVRLTRAGQHAVRRFAVLN